ncbi:MAG: ComF family protein [Pyrinomonadaceae bacterium]
MINTRADFRRASNLVYNSFLALAFPHPCRICGASVEERENLPVCQDCWNRTRTFAASDAAHDFDHASCGLKISYAVGPYARALRAAILELKREPYVCRYLTDQILKVLASTDAIKSAVIVPVPLYRERYVERGFNQAEVLARAIHSRTGMSLDTENLVRTSFTIRHRVGMDLRARRESVRGVFSLIAPDRVREKDILLVDDVMTTGATLISCAGELVRAGAGTVSALTIARVSAS